MPAAAIPTIKPTNNGARQWVGGTISIGLRLAAEALLRGLRDVARAGRRFPDPHPPIAPVPPMEQAAGAVPHISHHHPHDREIIVRKPQ